MMAFSIRNCAPIMNLLEYVLERTCVYTAVGYVSRSEVAGLSDAHMFT